MNFVSILIFNIILIRKQDTRTIFEALNLEKRIGIKNEILSYPEVNVKK